jgi:hypothetical protein
MIKFTLTHADWHIGDLWNTGRDMNEVRRWCTEQFGPVGTKGPIAKVSDARDRWQNNNTSLFFFRDERDWLWFVLRWS